ncbi:MAG TPA: hypothetical protein VFG68_16255 [Fimbriiglobus sp.]|nr:hypothetical protein [Fimbriiglobus sp.]
MSRFFDLFRHDTPPPPGQIYADDRSALFPDVVRQSPRLRLWCRDEPAPGVGRFLLVGVATWSGYDMKLLDLIEQTPDGPEVVGVFDTAECKSDADFEARSPGIGTVYQMPAVGLWEDGKLVARGWGHEGRLIVFRACGIDPDQMRELLDPRSVSA